MTRPNRLRLAGAGGFILLDAVVALAMTVALMITLTVALGHYRRAGVSIVDRKLAHERAEAALVSLQTAGDLLTNEMVAKAFPDVTFERMPDKAAPAFAWVKAKAVIGTATAEVYSMVPADAVPSDLPGGK